MADQNGWDARTSYNISPQEIQARQKRTEMRAERKAEFMMKKTNPFGPSNTSLYNPAWERYMQQRASLNRFDRFYNSRRSFFPYFLIWNIIPLVGLTYWYTISIKKADEQCREGLPYHARNMKYSY
ncbi:uncharacterized protein LOC106167049 [Lingula anatina]|uniref:NADH dehydrogenase [ubiquinone] 1 beta subcomplex subunit 4 n=1 Tax=Lingula anatina TaxID=7574 RepID=A0A1S3IUG7_LINAN|nr:uncharacterized protein LOC106167049 [Lingula anatina]|eukprot:XP_013401179.1 uncharacterized protein LOC106167049 [Lingula anatina]